MEFTYGKYSPDKGLEESEAKIFSDATGLVAIREEIKPGKGTRNPNYTRYVFKKDGTPIAYVTARISRTFHGRTYISYPWAKSECPPETQKSIFDDLMVYLKEQKETQEIAAYILFKAKNAHEQIEFFQREKFIEKERMYVYSLNLDLEEIVAWNPYEKTKDFDFRVATSEDLDELISFFRQDSRINHDFPNDILLKEYIESRILNEGHAIMIFKGEEIVAAGGVHRFSGEPSFFSDGSENILMRLSAVRTMYPRGWKILVFELAKKCIESGWEDLPLRIVVPFITESSTVIGLAELKSEFKPLEVFLVYQN